MKIRQRTWTKRAAVMLSLVAVTLPLVTNVTTASAKASRPNVAALLQPHEADYGYLVDGYHHNLDNMTYMTPTSDPVIGVINGFTKYWRDGKVVDQSMIDLNLAKSAKVTEERSASESERAYFSDRRDLRYNFRIRTLRAGLHSECRRPNQLHIHAKCPAPRRLQG